jgi:hypothetical protein
MTKVPKKRGILIIACLCVGLSFSLEGIITPVRGAQLGGFMKKVKEKVKPSDSSSSESSSVSYSDRVLELNDENLTKLEKSLQCEKTSKSKDKCSAAGGLTKDQFAVAKERILPFCSSGGRQKVGNYIYSSAEVKALKPRCEKLRKLIE